MLAAPDTLKQLAPNSRFALVTQNIDGLSRRALERTPGASPSASPIYEMHDHLFETVCAACGDRRMSTDSPICAALKGTGAVMLRHEPEPVIEPEHRPSTST